ncbi:MAG: peptide-methionine (S)-S-oxide reductase, partial [Cyanobium sp. MAG06]|nr:peptide-methionine (S)-S-oxide reductase [Cyanobium sp. MAG06]
MQKLSGAVEAVSGFANGNIPNPTYLDVLGGKTGFIETVALYYKDDLLYEDIIKYFLLHIDPFDNEGQFYDRGESYTPNIFYKNNNEKDMAERVIRELESKLDKNILVNVIPLINFYTAEDYHQDYAENNTIKYCAYREASGRDGFLEKTFQGKSYDKLISNTNNKSDYNQVENNQSTNNKKY